MECPCMSEVTKWVFQWVCVLWFAWLVKIIKPGLLWAYPNLLDNRYLTGKEMMNALTAGKALEWNLPQLQQKADTGGDLHVWDVASLIANIKVFAIMWSFSLRQLAQTNNCSSSFTRGMTKVTNISPCLSSPQVTHLLTPWSLKPLCSSSWRSLGTTRCTWTSQNEGRRCFSGSPSASPTPRALCATSCTSSWKRRCSLASYRTGS